MNYVIVWKRSGSNKQYIERLYNFFSRWLQDLRDQLRGRIIAEGDKYNQLARALVDAQNEQDYTILRSAKVVGMTTTGAAKYRDIVQRLPVCFGKSVAMFEFYLCDFVKNVLNVGKSCHC